MPEVIKEVNTLHATTARKLRERGPSAHHMDEGARGVMIQDMVASFCRDFTGALVEKRVSK